MIRIKDIELNEIVGGGLTGTIVNAFIGAGRFIYGLGQSLGSGLRRIGTNNLCPLR